MKNGVESSRRFRCILCNNILASRTKLEHIFWILVRIVIDTTEFEPNLTCDNCSGKRGGASKDEKTHADDNIYAGHRSGATPEERDLADGNPQADGQTGVENTQI